MANKTQAAKKSTNTKPSKVKRDRRTGDTTTQEASRNEEKTSAAAVKSKTGVAATKKSKASVDVKKSTTNLANVGKTQSNITVDKTIDEKEKKEGKKEEKKEEKTKRKEKKERKEKWSGEEAAGTFTRNMLTANMQTDYEEIQKMPAQVERCKIWQANSGRNRHPDYKCYDDSRLIVQMCKTDYINGTKINVPNFSPMIYLVQLPKLDLVDAVEEFWRMVFQDQCQAVHIIVRPEELNNAGIEKLFAQECGGYLYANGFFINTRKVERDTKRDATKADMFVVELLPEGCSNSVMCSVYLHTYWKPYSGPDRFGAQIRAAQQIAKNDGGNSPTVIVSVRGAGRNAALLALSVVVDQLTKGKEPKINEIVRAIREQRPMAVDSWPQYVSLYLATNWLIKNKVSTGPANDEMVCRIKKFNEKAMQAMGNSIMKQTTEEC